MERPLKEYGSKNRELSSMPGVQSDLASLAKSLEASQKKVEKAKDKGPKGADRLASAVTASEEVSQQWESRAPFVFEQLQAADESRLNHLRDALTQLETHEVDQVERCRQAAESCLNVLLNVETADEIKTFAAKVNGGRPVVSRRQQAASPPPVAPVAPLAPPPRIQDDAASQHSEASNPVRTPPGEYTPFAIDLLTFQSPWWDLGINADSVLDSPGASAPTQHYSGWPQAPGHCDEPKKEHGTAFRRCLLGKETPEPVCVVQKGRLVAGNADSRIPP